MRITKSKLRQIIREELARVNEQEGLDELVIGRYQALQRGGYDDDEPKLVGFFELDSPRGKWGYGGDLSLDGRVNVVGDIAITHHPGDPRVTVKNPIVLKPGHPEYIATSKKLSSILQRSGMDDDSDDTYTGRWTRDPHPSIPDSATAGIESDAEKAGLRDRRP